MDVKKQLQSLLKIQKLDIELSKYNFIIKSLPSEISAIKREYNSIDEKYNQLQTLKEKSIKERKHCDSKLEEINTKLLKYQEQLMSLKTNKEYSSKLSEIDNLKKKSAELEDKILENMEYIDAYENQLIKIKEELNSVRKDVDKKVLLKEKEIQNIENKISEIKTKKESLKAELKPKLINQYEKIYQARGTLPLSKANDRVKILFSKTVASTQSLWKKMKTQSLPR